MIDYRLMTIDDYEAAYNLWIKCGNGLNNKDDSREDLNYRNRALTEMVRIDPVIYTGIPICSVATFAAVYEGHFIRTGKDIEVWK